MIKELAIRNFRSIRDATLELGRFTVLTGANNSGKSSVLYALQVLKNVVSNPNKSENDLLNLGFHNLGGLTQTLFDKKENSRLEIAVKTGDGYHESIYGVKIGYPSDAFFIEGIQPFQFKGVLNISFPYTLNNQIKVHVPKEGNLELVWNGIAFVRPDEPWSHHRSLLLQILTSNTDIETLTRVPTNRGFSKPIFNQIPINGSIFTEDEVASVIAIDPGLQSKIAYYFEKITGKRFSVSMSPGVGFFFLQVREPDSPFTTELVNQGMGVNQIAFLLAKILYDKNRLICIDEPEIHLHPSLIEQFVKVLVEIAETEDKQFLFSTHSEHWLMSLLAEVYEQHLAPADVQVYFLQKDKGETTFEQQKVLANGQIEGGLKNFLAAEMSLAKRFFSAPTANV
ncbi:MAG: AAA family ATPase [Saprospiraceae bacterium]|nr:AAA family ATPase [Saprospiraceae bacterium]